MSDIFINGIHAMVSQKINREASIRGQMTLGEIVITLKQIDAEKPIRFQNGSYPGEYHSYRGYYEFISIATQAEKVTVGEFLSATQSAIGETYVGWKGGNFTMTKNTPVWISRIGRASGWYVSDVIDHGKYVEIAGMREDEWADKNMPSSGGVDQ